MCKRERQRQRQRKRQTETETERQRDRERDRQRQRQRQREGELKKMRGWTTSDVKRRENSIKTFRSETFFSYLQPLNKKEL